MASGSDEFSVPIPLQKGGIDVYECLEEERKEEREGIGDQCSWAFQHNILGYDKYGSRKHRYARAKIDKRVQCTKRHIETDDTERCAYIQTVILTVDSWKKR